MGFLNSQNSFILKNYFNKAQCFQAQSVPAKNILENKFLDDLDLPIFIKNTNGIYIYCNKSFINFLGISKNKILGHTAHEIAPRALADLYVSADKELLDSASNQSYGSQVQAATATTKTEVVFNKSILYTPQHAVVGFIGAIDVHTRIEKKVGADQACKLTPREMAVLKLLGNGLSVKGIANTLGISPHTTADHLKSIYLKLDVHSKNEALFKALTLFIITP